MTLEERNLWFSTALGLAAFAVYAVVLLVRLTDEPPTEVAWAGPMLWTVGIAGGLYALFYLVDRLLHRGTTVSDPRDEEIRRFGESISRGLVDLAALAAIVMLALDVHAFWVAHTLFVAGFVGAMIGSLAQISAYREGLPT